MAEVIGESGAWREIAANLRRRGLVVHQPANIKPLLNDLCATYPHAVERKQLEIAQCVASKAIRIACLRAERGVWRLIVNWFRIRDCKKAIEKLRAEERRYVAKLSENIERLKSLQESGELAGARAELDVIAHLARLPAEFTVFNDIRLKADRFIRFNGVPIQSAQIDHAVLSPAGLFLIETKCWSSRFVDEGSYHNPFDQTQRAGYLCYDQLRAQFGKVRVRSVIACAGKLPPVPKDSHIKVLPVSELVGYISWFKQTELSPGRLRQVHHYLERYVAP